MSLKNTLLLTTLISCSLSWCSTIYASNTGEDGECKEAYTSSSLSLTAQPTISAPKGNEESQIYSLTKLPKVIQGIIFKQMIPQELEVPQNSAAAAMPAMDDDSEQPMPSELGPNSIATKIAKMVKEVCEEVQKNRPTEPEVANLLSEKLKKSAYVEFKYQWDALAAGYVGLSSLEELADICQFIKIVGIPSLEVTSDNAGIIPVTPVKQVLFNLVTTLQELIIRNHSLNRHTLAWIGANSQLQSLTLENGNVFNDGKTFEIFLSLIPKLPCLTSLALPRNSASNMYHEERKDQWNRFTGYIRSSALTSLDLSHIGVNVDSLLQIFKLQNEEPQPLQGLVNLNISGNYLTLYSGGCEESEIEKLFKYFGNLTELDISDTGLNLSEESEAHLLLSQLPQLRTLTLTKPQGQNASMNLNQMPAFPWSKAKFPFLYHMPHLESIDGQSVEEFLATSPNPAM